MIDLKQFEEGLKSLKIFLNKVEIDVLFGAIDDNNSGCITAEEYYIFIEGKFNDILIKMLKLSEVYNQVHSPISNQISNIQVIKKFIRSIWNFK